MTQKIPEKHREIAHTWVDGADLEYSADNGATWQHSIRPTWNESIEYRVKVKEKVIRWCWVVVDSNGSIDLVSAYCTQKEIRAMFPNVPHLTQVEGSKKEFDE